MGKYPRAILAIGTALFFALATGGSALAKVQKEECPPYHSIIALRPSELVPLGAKPYRGILDHDVFGRFLAQGFMPIGEPRSLVNYDASRVGYPVFWHDLAGHFGSLLGDPQWMAANRRVTERLASQGIQLDQKAFDFQSVQARKTREPLYRINHAIESLNLTPPEARPVIDRALGFLEIPASNAPIGREKFAAALQKKSGAELDRLISYLHSERQKLFQDYGGTGYDGIGIQGSALQGFNLGDYNRVTPKYVGMAIHENWSRYDDPKKRQALTAYLSVIDSTSRISAVEWIEEVSHLGDLKPGGKGVLVHLPVRII